MSHMPHSHDIVGLGTARGTSHTLRASSSALLAQHLSLSGKKRDKGKLPLSTWLGFLIVPQKDKKTWCIHFVPFRANLSCENSLIGTCKSYIQSSKRPFPLVGRCLLESNNVSMGLSLKQSKWSLEGQSDQIDL